MKWFLWWVQRDTRLGLGPGQWYGPRALTDYGAWSEELDIERATRGVLRLYRWVWTGAEWQYDTRPRLALLAPPAGRYATL